MYTGPKRLALLGPALGLVLCFGAEGAVGNTPAGGAAPTAIDDLNAVATIGSAPVLYKALHQRVASQLEIQQSEYDLAQRQLAQSHERKRHELLKRELDKMLDERALQLEASARGTSPDVVLADIKVAPVTDADMHAFYDSRKDQTTQPYEQLAEQIKTFIATDRSALATRSFYDGLRDKYHIKSALAPYRLAIAPVGPSRGDAHAPVTIVEFGDFQCPYCAQAESTLHAVLALHPQDVRLVFRNFPLTDVHEHAQTAARVGVCASRQGKFWELHDAMYANQNALSGNALNDLAKSLGLDTDRLGQCMADKATGDAISFDVADGNVAGVNSTPSFFINGRPLSGSVPAAAFETIIREELSSPRRKG